MLEHNRGAAPVRTQASVRTQGSQAAAHEWGWSARRDRRERAVQSGGWTRPRVVWAAVARDSTLGAGKGSASDRGSSCGVGARRTEQLSTRFCPVLPGGPCRSLGPCQSLAPGCACAKQIISLCTCGNLTSIDRRLTPSMCW